LTGNIHPWKLAIKLICQTTA